MLRQVTQHTTALATMTVAWRKLVHATWTVYRYLGNTRWDRAR